MKKHDFIEKIYLFVVIIVIAVLTSCSNQTDNKNNVVKIWWYEDAGDTLYNYVMKNAIDKIVSYAEASDIEIDIRKFSYAELSYSDYVLKRNLAIEYGEVNITFDTSGNLYGLKEKAGSYERITSYQNIFDNFKNWYCIPLYTDLRVNFVNNDVLKIYGIQPENVITLNKYYEIKQSMKRNGAEFKLNAAEFEELVEYYSRENNLKILTEQGRLSIDKKAALTALHDLVDDIKNNYDYDYFINNTKNVISNFEYKIIEKTSGYDFSGLEYNYLSLNYQHFSKEHPSIENYTIVLMDNNRYNSFAYNNYLIPCMFIPHNNKNNDAYTIADALFSDGFQIFMYTSGNVGVITNSEKTREYIGFDENWNYIGVRNITDADGNKISLKAYPRKEEEKLYEILTKGYEIIRNRDMSDYFSDNKYNMFLNEFVWEIAIAAIKDDKIFDDFDKIAYDFIINLNIGEN